MFARITPYKMKPGSKAAATKIMDGLKDQIMALPGQVEFINVMDDATGEGYVVSLTSLEETPAGAAEKIKALWGAFAEFLEGTPSPSTYSVVADWKKG